MKTKKASLLCGISILLLTDIVESMWEPLLIYDFASANRTSPEAAWNTEYSNQTYTGEIAEELIYFRQNSEPIVSRRIRDWETSQPDKIRVQALGINLEEMETVYINTTLVTDSNWKAWMRARYIIKDNATTDVTISTRNFVFVYNYTRNQLYNGMALMWEPLYTDTPGILLISKRRQIGDYDDIRHNLMTHRYISQYPGMRIDPVNNPREERISSNNTKICLADLTEKDILLSVYLSSVLYRLEPGVRVSLITLDTPGSLLTAYWMNLKTTRGQIIIHTFLGGPRHVRNPENVHFEDIEIVCDRLTGCSGFIIEISYTYVPYHVANYLMIEGFYPPLPFSESSSASTVEQTTTPESMNSSDSVSPSTESSNISGQTTTPNYGHTHVDPITTSDPANPNSRQTTTNQSRDSIDPMETTVTSDPSDRLTSGTGTASFIGENTTSTEDTSLSFIPAPTTIDDINNVDKSTVTIATDTVTTLVEHVSNDQSTSLTQITTTDTSDTRQSTERPTGMCTRGCPCTQMVWGNTTLTDLDPETLAEVLQMISELKAKLTVDKVTLSTYKAKKNSATDKRTSASGNGAVSVVILVIVITVVTMADVTSFLKSGKRTRRKKDRK